MNVVPLISECDGRVDNVATISATTCETLHTTWLKLSHDSKQLQ